MTIGFVLIKAAPGLEHKVYDKLSKISEITKLYPLIGEHNFMAKVEVESYDKLGSTAVKKIRSIEGVLKTKTLIGQKF